MEQQQRSLVARATAGRRCPPPGSSPIRSPETPCAPQPAAADLLPASAAPGPAPRCALSLDTLAQDPSLETDGEPLDLRTPTCPVPPHGVTGRWAPRLSPLSVLAGSMSSLDLGDMDDGGSEEVDPEEENEEVIRSMWRRRLFDSNASSPQNEPLPPPRELRAASGSASGSSSTSSRACSMASK
eukprot:m51a1_g9400 hypothetical protein (184) ;mRNA; f:292617-293292